MSVANYEQVLQMTRQLELSDLLRLLATLAEELQRQVERPQRRSIMELEGLGAEIWQEISAQEYVDQERNSWE